MSTWLTRSLQFQSGSEGSGGEAGAAAPVAGETPKTGGEEGDYVRVPRKDYDQLRDQANKVPELQRVTGELEKDWKAAQRLVRVDPNAKPEDLEADTRHVMAKAGYSTGDIDAHIESMRAERTAAKPGRKPSREEMGGEEDAEVAQLKQQMSQMQKKQFDSELQTLRRTLDETVESQLDNNKEVVMLMQGLVKHNTDEDTDPTEVVKYKTELRETMSSEILRETQDRLRARKAQAGGQWDDGWIQEEGVKAAAAVNARYRKLLGNPSRLGRSPGTAVDQDRFANTKPIAPPSYQKGNKHADLQPQIRNWATDMLTRSLAEDSTGSSRV